MKKVMYVVLGIVVLLVIMFSYGMVKSNIEVGEIRDGLVRNSVDKKYDIDQLNISSLPEPVQRYINFAFKGKKQFDANVVSWKERGDFNLPEIGHFSMSSWQVSRTDAPYYVWRGFMKKLGGLITLESRDAFMFDRHDMRAKFFGLKTIMKSGYVKSEDVNSVYSYLMLRYFGTSLNFPWGLVTSPHIKWTAIDENSALMTAAYNDLKADYIVSFDGIGRVVKMEGTEYHLHGNNELLKETAYKSDYVEWNGVMVPTAMHYVWTDKAGNETSYKFRIYNMEIID